MDLKRLPPSLLVALGLAVPLTEGCTATTVGACLDVAVDDTTGTTTGEGSSTVGPCLDVAPPTTTVGPCLGAEPPGTSSGTDGTTGTGDPTGTDTTPDTDTDTDTSTGGGANDSAPADRSTILGRLLGAGVLPDDVAARLSGDKAGD